MKHKFFYLCLFATLSIQTTLHAECIDLSLDYTAADIQAIITDYKANATTITANSYEICFVNEFETDAAFTITPTGNDKIILKGLKIKDTVAPFISANTFLTLTGANITVDGAFFTGNGNSAAIQVNGANVIIKNSTIKNFATALWLAMADGLELDNNTYEQNQKDVEPSYLFDPNYFGRKCDKRKEIEKDDKKYELCDDSFDTNLVVKLAGKPPKNMQDCSGNIDIYKFNVLDASKTAVANCSLKKLEGDKPLYFARYKDEILKIDEIKVGECSFECEVPPEKQLTTKNTVFITHNGQPTMFQFDNKLINRIKLDNFADVPSTGLGGVVMAPVPSEADTGATGTTDTPGTGNVTDTIGGPNIDGTGDNGGSGDGNGSGSSGDSSGGGGSGQSKAGSSGDGYTAKAGAACSLVGIMGATGPINPSTMLGTSRATTAIPFLFSLLGLVPITWRRITKK